MDQDFLKWLFGVPVTVLLCAICLGLVYVLIKFAQMKLGISKGQPTSTPASGNDPDDETSGGLTPGQAARLRNIETKVTSVEQRLIELVSPPGRLGLMTALERLITAMDAAVTATRSETETQAKILVTLTDMLREVRTLAEEQTRFMSTTANAVASRSLGRG